MSKNVKINNTTYSGIKSVLIPLANSSGNAQFRDEDEVITKPTATKTITENGSNIDVMDYAKVTVNVPTESELSLNGITTSPASVTVAKDATVDTVKAAITSATASYTASGYTGTMTKAITVSELTVSGTVPANGTTGNMTVSWGGKSTTLSVTVEAASAAGDTTAYAWATIPAYYSSMYLPKTAGEYLTLKKTEASSAEEYGAAVNSDIDLSDTSKTVTVTIDGTLYDANGGVSTEDAGGLLNAQLTRTNGTWAMNWLEFQEGGTRHTTFSTSTPANVEISGSEIRICAGKRIFNSSEYDIKFNTTKSNYRVDYKITVVVS